MNTPNLKNPEILNEKRHNFTIDNNELSEVSLERLLGVQFL